MTERGKPHLLTYDEAVAAVDALLAEAVALTPADIVAALRGQGVEQRDLPDIVEQVVYGDDIDDLMPIGDGRYIKMTSFLSGRTLTHRLSAEECAQGYLLVDSDLDPFSMLTEWVPFDRLVDGSPIASVLPEFDQGVLRERGIDLDGSASEVVWLLDQEALTSRRLKAGDLIGVTVGAGGFELALVEKPQMDVATLGAELVTFIGEHSPDEPMLFNDLVWQLMAAPTGPFDQVVAPISEALTTVGMSRWKDDVAAPGIDIARHSARQRVADISQTYRLNSADSQAVFIMATVAHSSLFGPHDPEVLAATYSAIFDPANPEPDLSGSPLLAAISTDREAISGALARVAVPAVAEALVMEVLGSLVETASGLMVLALAALSHAPRAARPNLLWIQGKCAQRLGERDAAEATYERAVELDPACELALYELAEFASDRSDAVRGMSLLRRAGTPPEDPLYQLMQRYLPVTRRDIGRNEPCWCGSGRKYKVCHLNRENLPLETRGTWLYYKLCRYVDEGPWRFQMLDLAHIRAEHSSAPDALLSALEDPLLVDLVIFEGGGLQAYLDERGDLLPDDELLLATQWQLLPRSIYRVTDVVPGLGFTAHDLRTGESEEVHEGAASQQLKVGMLISTHLLHTGEILQAFGGIEEVPLSDRDALIELLDREGDADEVVWFLSRRYAPPTLVNTQGDPLIFCEAIFKVADTPALVRHLDATYDVVERGGTWLAKAGDSIAARLTLTGAELLVETNSEPRMDRVHAELTAAVATLKLLNQSRRTLDELAEERSDEPTEPAGFDLSDQVGAAAIKEVILKFEKSWPDDHIPALKGKTPRECAADPTRRGDLIDLLDSFPEVAADDFTQMSAVRLRKDLGLT